LPHPIIAQLPRVIGHRGAMGSAPENTLASLRRAAELGARWVEFDVAISADEQLLLFHDDQLARITGRAGRFADSPASLLVGLDAGAHFDARFSGERIPGFAAAAALLGELGLGANLEIKVPEARAEIAVARLADELARHWPRGLPLLLSSFSEVALAAAARRLPQLPRGLLLERLPADWRRRAEALDAVSLHLAEASIDAALCAALRGAGYPLLAYTVNRRQRAAELFGWGVRAVFSDYPERLLDLAADGVPR